MIVVTDVEPKHILDVYENLRFEKLTSLNETHKLVSYQMSLGVAKSLVDTETNKAVAIIGIFRQCPGVGGVWLLGTNNITKNKISFCRAVRKLMKIYVPGLKLHRLEIACRKDIPTAWRFAESLGFKREGLRRQADEFKDDWYIYGRLF